MVSIVKPCYICGLPLLVQHSQFDPPKTLKFRCNNEKDCIRREYRDYVKNGYSYRSALSSKDVSTPWLYEFTIRNDEIATDVSIVGPWLPTSFDSILSDALEFANYYDSPSFIIENKAGDILYEEN
jgi:hypothetical protein